MTQINVVYNDTDIPKFHELKEKFTKSAQYSEDGKSVTVGQYQAYRRSFWSLRQYIGFDCFDLERKKVGLSAYFFLHSRRRELDEAVDILSGKQASMALTEDDRTQNAIRALEAKITEFNR